MVPMSGLGRRPAQAPSLAASLPFPQARPIRHRRSNNWGTILSRTATFALFAGAYYLVLTRYSLADAARIHDHAAILVLSGHALK